MATPVRTWSHWCGNERSTPARVLTPGGVDDVVDGGRVTGSVPTYRGEGRTLL